jgi:hypothetical protein
MAITRVKMYNTVFTENIHFPVILTFLMYTTHSTVTAV